MEPGCADPCFKLVVRVAVLVSVRPRVATLLLCGPRVGCRAKVFMRLSVSLRFSDLMAASTHTWQVVQEIVSLGRTWTLVSLGRTWTLPETCSISTEAAPGT